MLAVMLLVEAVAIEYRQRKSIIGHLGVAACVPTCFLQRANRKKTVGAGVVRCPSGCFGRFGRWVASRIEHGAGRFQQERVEETEAQERIDAIRTIKRVMDPKGILNPGAVVSGEED